MKKPPLLIGFLQALGLTAYVALVSIIFWKGNEWLPIGNLYIGPVLVLSLLVVSVLICALIVFTYPIYLFWDKKKTKKALKIVGFTAGWLTLFVLITIFCLLILV